MKITCPHCSQRLDLDAVTLESLHDSRVFECPACGGSVSLADSPGDHARTPSPSPGGWVAPDAEVLSQSFDSRYRIIRLLGRGGMGAVYEGLDSRLDRRVAIKILPMETGRGMDALARFEREAKAMAALDHPNIVHIHDYGSTADGHPYFVMEFIDGMDLHGLRHSGNLDLPGALEIISQVCSALHYAHGRGIVHRDIKPANIMVTREGVAKVADFGLAKVLGTETNPQYDPTLTRSGAAMGTPDYMAPEQLEGNPVDHRADIYSLGVMLYALLTGSPPRGAWPPPSQRVEIDIRLDEIVIRALQQNPSARYQAASEVKGDIDSVKSSTGGGPLPPGVDPAPLPSSRPAIPATHQTSSAPGHAKSKSQPVRTRIPDAEILSTTRSLNTTMLVLGTLAILIIGGLAAYLANRKTGDTYHTEQTITTSVTNNTYFTQLIASGATTAKDLEAVSDIRAFENGFIGMSEEDLTWEQAEALAERTGAEIITVDPSGSSWQTLIVFLGTHFKLLSNAPAWVRENGASRILDGSKLKVPDSSDRLEFRYKALLFWQTDKTPSQAKADSPVPPADAVESPPESGDWIDLIDGQDVSKWRGSKDPGFPHGAWVAEDGALRNLHGNYDQNLETLEKFRDFELEFEWKFSAGGNSGIFYGEREFQLVDDDGSPNGKTPVTSCGALCYFIPPNAQKRIEPAGKYNRGKLIVRGNQVEHWINGQKVLEYQLGSPALESLVESGQFKSLPGYKEIPTTAGDSTIGLQSHGGNVWFRNIRIRKLDGSQSDNGQAVNTSPIVHVPNRPASRVPEKHQESVPRGPLSWTNIDGKTIQAEFVRNSGDAIVIRKDGTEFSIPISKLTPASAAQARTLALQPGLKSGNTGSLPGKGKRVVLLAGDVEYRSEEALPQLAKILSRRHGFECIVLHSINKKTGEIDPTTEDNQPGMEALASADLVIISLYFRNWPEAQMKHFAAYIASGKPVIALRTSTHAFKGLSGTHAAFNHFGEDMLGAGWISHWGNHKRDGGGATRGEIEPAAMNDVLLRGVTDIFAETNVYEVALPADAKVLVRGLALNGGNPGDSPATYLKRRIDGKEQGVNSPPMPIVWTRTASGPPGRGNRILCLTVGSARDIQNEGLRRLIVNGVFSFTGLAVPAKADVALVGDYKPSSDRGGGFITGKKPEDYFPEK